MKRKWIIRITLFCFVLGYLIYGSIFRFSINFHVVDEGKFYRSAQMTPEELEETIKKHNIRTVINLRGRQAGTQWFEEELNVTEELGVEHYSFGFSSKEIPHPWEVVPYLSALENVPRPILVHCRAGSDRTGQAVALYSMLYMGEEKERALGHLNFWDYGHIKWARPGKRRFIEMFQGEEWARNEYDPCDPNQRDYYEQDKYCSGPEVIDCCQAQKRMIFAHHFLPRSPGQKQFARWSWCSMPEDYLPEVRQTYSGAPRIYCSRP